MDMESPRRGYSTGAPSGHRGSATHLHDRPHLDGAHPGPRDAGRDGGGLVEVLRFHDVVPAELLARLGERAVGRDGLAVLYAHGRGGRARLERVALLVVAALADPLG